LQKQAEKKKLDHKKNLKHFVAIYVRIAIFLIQILHQL
jgi:hypothetical protein